eukprot:TRINITY_DN68432_c0_g1_i1.p1 TRINITY_DN68432_c0_g1~~TRINITY_DN68432_c0_g1_i1.p1  ORF type:complete len:456 (-),score=108.52 TRINITY_DN68432_c0_g1_i1:141-1508(-)
MRRRNSPPPTKSTPLSQPQLQSSPAFGGSSAVVCDDRSASVDAEDLAQVATTGGSPNLVASIGDASCSVGAGRRGCRFVDDERGVDSAATCVDAPWRRLPGRSPPVLQRTIPSGVGIGIGKSSSACRRRVVKRSAGLYSSFLWGGRDDGSGSVRLQAWPRAMTASAGHGRSFLRQPRAFETRSTLAASVDMRTSVTPATAAVTAAAASASAVSAASSASSSLSNAAGRVCSGGDICSHGIGEIVYPVTTPLTAHTAFQALVVDRGMGHQHASSWDDAVCAGGSSVHHSLKATAFVLDVWDWIDWAKENPVSATIAFGLAGSVLSAISGVVMMAVTYFMMWYSFGGGSTSFSSMGDFSSFGGFGGFSLFGGGGSGGGADSSARSSTDPPRGDGGGGGDGGFGFGSWFGGLFGGGEDKAQEAEGDGGEGDGGEGDEDDDDDSEEEEEEDEEENCNQQ